MKRLTALSLLLAGCVDPAEFIPKVGFDRVDVQALSFTEIETDLVFLVYNPNPVRVGVAEFGYAFDLEDTNLFQGDNADGLRLLADDTSEIALPIDLLFADTWSAVQAAKGEDRVDFRVAGKFGFDTPIGVARVPYDHTGQFPALRTPRITFDKIELIEAGLQSASLSVDLRVENDHASELFFDNFDYALTMEGNDIGTGSLQTFGVPGGFDTISLPFTLSFGALGGAIIDALTSGNAVTMGISASADVQTPFGTIPLQISESGDVSIPNPS